MKGFSITGFISAAVMVLIILAVANRIPQVKAFINPPGV